MLVYFGLGEYKYFASDICFEDPSCKSKRIRRHLFSFIVLLTFDLILYTYSLYLCIGTMGEWKFLSELNYDLVGTLFSTCTSYDQLFGCLGLYLIKTGALGYKGNYNNWLIIALHL